MVGFSITTQDTGAISGLKRIAQLIATAPKATLEAGGKAGLNQAQNVVPVRTGFLRGSLYYKVNTDNLEIGGKADYTAAVEFGNRGRPARPFIRPGTETAYKEILARLPNELGLN